jgi:hypothetical protein
MHDGPAQSAAAALTAFETGVTLPARTEWLKPTPEKPSQFHS